MGYLTEKIKFEKNNIKKSEKCIKLLEQFKADDLKILDVADIILIQQTDGVFLPKEYVDIVFKSFSHELFKELLEVLKPLPVVHWVNVFQYLYPLLPKVKSKISSPIPKGFLRKDIKHACPFFLYPNISFYGYFKCGGLPLVRITMGDRSGVEARLSTWENTEDFKKWLVGKEV